MSNLDKPLKPSSFKLTKLSEIRENPNNPRTIKEDKFEKLVRSIQTFPEMLEARPIVVNPDMVVLGGNMRLKACKAAGLTDAPVYVASWEESKAKEFIVKDNVGFGEWDWDILANEWDAVELEEWGLDVWTPEEEPTEGLTDPDEVPSVPEEPKTKLGDLYILGEHRLLCGDSTKADDVERLMNGERADMVFTDPPYGIDFQSQKGDKIKNDAVSDENLLVFNKQWQKRAFEVSKQDCFLMAWQSPRKFILMDFLGDWRFFRLVTMYKSNRISFPHGAWINKTEPCLIFQKGKPQPTEENYLDDCYVYTHDKESHEDSNVGHPTPKPVKMIIEHITACAKNKHIILDLFLGSGSTIIAAEKTGRKCYGMELDPKYCDVIVKRWEDFTGKKAELWKP